MQLERRHKELFCAAKNGDSHSLGILLKYYQPTLYSHALHIFGLNDTAHDVVQETFIIALTHIDEVRSWTTFGGWLHTVLRNHCLMLKRKKEQEIPFSKMTGRSVEETIYEDGTRLLEDTKYEEQVRIALALMPEHLRVVTLLRYFCRYNSYQQIATILQIPIGTVRSRLAEAKKQISSIFPDDSVTSHPLLNEGEKRARFFREMLDDIYNNRVMRNDYLELHDEGMYIIANSGKVIRNGRKYWEKEIYDDFKYGSRFVPDTILSSGNISILEGRCENTPELPDRCPHEATIVYYHHNDLIFRMRLFERRNKD